MRVLRDSLKVDVLSKLHVLGVDAHDFHSSDFIRDTNINFPIEATGSSKGWVNSVGPVRGSNNNDLASTFGTVHEGKQLGNDSLFGLTG